MVTRHLAYLAIDTFPTIIMESIFLLLPLGSLYCHANLARYGDNKFIFTTLFRDTEYSSQFWTLAQFIELS